MVYPCIYIRTLGVRRVGEVDSQMVCCCGEGYQGDHTGVSHTCSVQYYLSVYTFVVTVCFACMYYLRMIIIPARCVVRGAIPVCH